MRGELKNILLGCGILLLVGIGVIFYQTIKEVLPTLQPKNIDNKIVVKNTNNINAPEFS